MDKKILTSVIKEKIKNFTQVSDEIWEYAEPAYKETKSKNLQIKVLQEEGFDVVENLGGIPTAFKASFGSKKPVIAFLGEFDALPTMSQKADVLVREEISQEKWGHGCGHHLLGTGAMQGAVAVKDYMEKNNIEGTIIYYGCPAEEGEAGKAFMVKEGVFNGCDICLTWHPFSINIGSTSSLANVRVKYKFIGKSSHAAVSPHLGRSALDAVELMNVGVNYMREHMHTDCRVHYAITNTGGNAPNVVQSEAEVLYAIRAPRYEDTLTLFERVSNVARGAALMTETKVEININAAYADIVQNSTLDNLIFKNMKEFSPVDYSKEDLEYAQKFRDIGDKVEIQTYKSMIERVIGKKADGLFESPIARFVIPPTTMKQGSTDVGDVSQCIPTAWFSAACYALGTSAHSWQAVSQGKSSIAHKGMTYAASVLAATAIELMENQELVACAKNDFEEAMGGNKYTSIIPKDLKPSILR